MSNDIQEWPPSEHALKTLQEAGRLRYGELFLWSELEELFNLGSHETVQFRAELIRFSQRLKLMGFWLSERGTKQTGTRIIAKEAMADSVRIEETRKANGSLMHSMMLNAVNREGLSETDVRKLDHWEEKTAILGATAKALLRRRNLPSPEMVIKSVRDIR